MSYYEEQAKSTAEAYEAVDFAPVMTTIMKYLPRSGQLLDLGCGSGRDAAFFLAQGYDVTALDGSEAMLREAAAYHPELVGRLLHHVLPEPLPFDKGSFDILISMAVLMHLEKELLPEVFSEIARVIGVPGAVAYSANTRRPGLDEAGNDDKGRHFTCLPAETWERLHSEAGLETVAGWESDDIIRRPGIRWVTFVCRGKEG
jgi:SAM-dependent methyltransferase